MYFNKGCNYQLGGIANNSARVGIYSDEFSKLCMCMTNLQIDSELINAKLLTFLLPSSIPSTLNCS